MSIGHRTAAARAVAFALLAALAATGCGATHGSATTSDEAPASLVSICRTARLAIEPLPGDTFAETGGGSSPHFFEEEFLRAMHAGHASAAKAHKELAALAASGSTGSEVATVERAAARAASGFTSVAGEVAGHYPAHPTGAQNAGLVTKFETVSEPFLAACSRATR